MVTLFQVRTSRLLIDWTPLDSEKAIPGRRNPQTGRKRRIRRSRRFPRKLLIQLVAAAGLEPATYGL